MSDIRLSQFIEEHKTEYLCRNLYEWSEPVVSYTANLILELLNMPPLLAAQKVRASLIEEISGSELPVYPSVQKADIMKFSGMDGEMIFRPDEKVN